MATAVWKGQLTFGLVSVPVRLYRAARKERLRLHYVAAGEHEQKAETEVQSPSRVRQPIRDQQRISSTAPTETADDVEAPPALNAPVSRITQSYRRSGGEGTISRSDLLRGHEVAPDQYVTFTQQELRSLRPETSSEMKIVRSVLLAEIDPVYFESSYYVAPDPAGEHGYTLLYMALKESGFVTLAMVAMHGRERVVVIRPGAKGLLAHTMYYQNEVRAEEEYETKISDVPSKEVLLARTFVEAIAGPFAPDEFNDSHRKKLESLVSAKLARGEVRPGTSAEQVPAAVDILEALRKSIEQSQNSKREEVPRRGPARVTEIKKPKKRHA